MLSGFDRLCCSRSFWPRSRALWNWRANLASASNYSSDFSSEMAGFSSLLLLAGNTEQTTAARMLIERGADVNAQNWMGQTALFRAATGSNTGMIELLAAHGADPNIRDRSSNCDRRFCRFIIAGRAFYICLAEDSCSQIPKAVR